MLLLRGTMKSVSKQDFSFPSLAKMVFTQKQRTVEEDMVHAQV